MQKIIPHLWFDSRAEEAAKLYTSLFKDSNIGTVTHYGKAGFEIHHQPEGTVMTIEFELAGNKFIGLNGGPYFHFTPAVSFMVGCDTKEEVDELWKHLSKDGKVMMELGEYPFSQRYGWTEDAYGLSWQIMLNGDTKPKQKISPALLFVGDQYGRAKEAVNFYTSVFHNSSIDHILPYGKNDGPDKEDATMHAGFTIEGQEFSAMDSAHKHLFGFSEAISFMIPCNTQEEIDYYWDRLTVGGDEKAQQCGWLKDKFGVSWQITPSILDTMMKDKDPKKVERVMNAFFKMKKFDIAELQKAYDQA